MTRLGTAICEAVIHHYGRGELLSRLSDPFWFQALGTVMGMDWHSSGITTSVVGALKRGLNPRAAELGLYVCGGRGRHSRRTPDELRGLADRLALDGEALVRASRLTARVDNNAVADGFQIYLHAFFVTDTGEWAVVQQGLNDARRTARRYHWHSAAVRDFTINPHTAIVGEPTGLIRNLVDAEARPAQDAMIALTHERPDVVLREAGAMAMPRHHEVRAEDVDLKRLGTPTRFRDPARFSFAHGGKDGHPFPVPLTTYDETITVLRRGLDRAALGQTDKLDGFRRLDRFVRAIEERLDPTVDFDAALTHERAISPSLGGRTMFDDRRPRPRQQLRLF